MKDTQPRGFTLVEALIVMGLLSGLLLVMTTLFVQTVSVQTSSASASAIQTDGQFIMARLNYDIARATAITTPVVLGSSASTLAMTVNATAYVYVLNGANLQLTDATGPATLNSNRVRVSALTFTRLGNSGGNDTVRYSLTLTGTIRHNGQIDVQTFTSTAALR